MTENWERIRGAASDAYWRHTLDLAFVKDMRGAYVCASHAFAQMVGYADAAALIGKTDFDIFADKELAKRYTDDDARLLAGGLSLENYVEPITGRNGRPRYSVTSKYILRDAKGALAGIYGTGRDITVEYEARKNYESELRSLLELPPDALAAAWFDITAWRVVDVRYRDETNHVVSRYSQIDEYFANVVDSVVDDESVRDFFSGLSQEFLQAEYNRGRRNHSFEYRRRMADRAELWVRDEFHFLLDPVNGNLALIIILRDIDASRRKHFELVQAAERDAMTGLLNHDATIKCIKGYIAGADGEQALFMIDLDNFKQINDTFGHQYGDSILCDAADAICNVFRTTDVVGRMGGDEFMVLMKDVHSEEAVRHKAGELIAALQFSSVGEGKIIELTTSVGITLFSAAQADFNVLYGEADTALYQAKREGKNRYSLYVFDGHSGKRGIPSPALENVSTVQLRTLLTYMDGGVMLAEVGTELRITYVSPSFYRSFGRKKEEGAEPGKAFFRHVLAEDVARLRTVLQEASHSSDIREHTYRVRDTGGVEWRHIRIKRIPESGDGVHRLVAVITDISGLKRTNEHLREAEERYRTAVEQADAMLWEVDLATKTLMLTSPAWTKFGYGASVFRDAPESYLHTGAIHPDSVARFRRMYADIFAGSDGESYYFQMRNETGGTTWIKDHFKILRGADGVPSCALGITQLVPNIDAEMHRFAQERRFAGIVQDSLLGCVFANFTRNRIESVDINGDDRYCGVSGMAYDRAQESACVGVVHAADQESFRLMTSREYLVERFLARENWKFIDYRRIMPDGDCRWVSLFIKLMRHPISGDIYAFQYIRDNETRRRWELTLGKPLERNTTLLLYSRESMEALSQHIIDTSDKNTLLAVSVIELMGLERVRDEMGAQAVGEILFTFGRICRIVISGDVIIGQLEENRIALLRANALSHAAQRERIAAVMRLLKELLTQAHPEARVDLIGGFAAERAEHAVYAQLLRKAGVACRSAAQTLGESVVAYADPGIAPLADAQDGDLAEKYRALELRYQQQANLLRTSENDALTGLLSKQAFYHHVRAFLNANAGEKLALVRLDVNRFKVFNDVRGIAAGDALLRDIADGIRRAGKRAILCTRLESDHFVLLTPDDEESILRSLARLVKWLADYAPDFRLSFTAGVYRISDPSVETSLMCDRALLALRSVKSAFDTRLAYYDDTLRDKLLEEQRLVDDMGAALEHGQFELHFQPQVNYENGLCVGAEALVRWNHPERGLLGPDMFIPLFEKHGMIMLLDEYVWDRCCRYIRDWTDRYPQARELSLSVSVNVSRLDIYDTKLCAILCGLIKKYGLPPAVLRLEITESAYMEDPRQLIDMVHKLQKAGFIVEMDDFGSGYSSLNTLKDVCVDVLKLDMKFLDDCADSARGGNILSSVIRMAHWLRLPIIAEGVETKAQADYLKSLGCIYMQGYFFARPMPAGDFEKLLERGVVSFADRFRDANVAGMAAFWDPSAQAAMLFNSFVGGAAIMEYRGDVLEAVRVNDSYYRTLGTTREAYLPLQTNILARFDAENRAIFRAELRRALESGEECGCETQSLPHAGIACRYVRSRMRVLAQSEGSALFYIAIENITERKQMEEERAAYVCKEDVVNRIVGLFYDTDDLAGALETTLAMLGEYYDLSRAYIFEDDEAHAAATNTFEWCAPGVAPQKAFLQNIPYAAMGGRESYLRNFNADGVYYCPDVGRLSPEERAVLEPQGIRSMLQYAVRNNGAYAGMIGFDECRENRRWTEEQCGTLMLVSRIIGAYLLRLR